MDWKKDYLKLVGLGAIVVVAISVAAYVYSYTQTMQPASAFTVSGEGKVVMVPDTAKFTFTVLTQGDNDPVKLQAENTKTSNAIIKYLQDQGVDKKDIKTEGYYLNPQYTYSVCRTGTCPPPKISGYDVRNTLSVKTKDFTKAGELISGVTELGANEVSGVELTVDDRTILENQARAEAMQSATQKAKTMAKAGGFRLGRLLSIDEYSPGMPIPMYGYGGMGGGAIDSTMPKEIAPAVDIQPGSQDIVVNVTLRYEIK
ncbi:SIMPL domain-containing protein [Patescibacteria group bacterium]|nr:SIMPL domain-containing protein [Patescibacteria group bacterium]